MHVRDRAQFAIVTLVSLLWVAGSVICPVPLLAGEAAAGHDGRSHGVELPGAMHHQAGTCCEIPGQLNIATVQSVDQQLRDQFWSGDQLPLINLAASLSIIRVNLSQLLVRGTGPPRMAGPRYTKNWPQAPPV